MARYKDCPHLMGSDVSLSTAVEMLYDLALVKLFVFPFPRGVFFRLVFFGLSHQRQVFGGAVPYLSYNEAPLQPAMKAHREQSKTVPDKVVAVFRETVLPCMPEDGLASPNVEARGESTAWNRRSAEDLAAAGMARVARLRGLEGEDRGVTMVGGMVLSTC